MANTIRLSIEERYAALSHQNILWINSYGKAVRLDDVHPNYAENILDQIEDNVGLSSYPSPLVEALTRIVNTDDDDEYDDNSDADSDDELRTEQRMIVGRFGKPSTDITGRVTLRRVGLGEMFTKIAEVTFSATTDVNGDYSVAINVPKNDVPFSLVIAEVHDVEAVNKDADEQVDEQPAESDKDADEALNDTLKSLGSSYGYIDVPSEEAREIIDTMNSMLAKGDFKGARSYMVSQIEKHGGQING